MMFFVYITFFMKNQEKVPKSKFVLFKKLGYENNKIRVLLNNVEQSKNNPKKRKQQIISDRTQNRELIILNKNIR